MDIFVEWHEKVWKLSWKILWDPGLGRTIQFEKFCCDLKFNCVRGGLTMRCNNEWRTKQRQRMREWVHRSLSDDIFSSLSDIFSCLFEIFSCLSEIFSSLSEIFFSLSEIFENVWKCLKGQMAGFVYLVFASPPRLVLVNASSQQIYCQEFA